MLVLSRKIGEKIHVGNDITIEVRRVAGNRVTLAVDAPREMRILRGELQAAALEIELEVQNEDGSSEQNEAGNGRSGNDSPGKQATGLGGSWNAAARRRT